MSRILGIDFGSRRVGLAVSDPLGITAQGLETIEYAHEEELFVRLAAVIEAYEVAEIVVGLPLSLDGTCGEKAKTVQDFIENVRTHFRLPVVPWDERLSTTAAHRTMHEMGKKAKRAKGKVDRIAAALILQNYLDRVRKDNE
ncbi:MAG: Holliday junction resolvase RuvX [Gemmatimonadota bacterium]|nr:MAG: Holliday junction resolvase RuvX [Gemmatimonadota bacterium]